MVENPKVIWLAPACEDERTWCEDNMWPNGCEECGMMPVKYVLAEDQSQMKTDMK